MDRAQATEGTLKQHRGWWLQCFQGGKTCSHHHLWRKAVGTKHLKPGDVIHFPAMRSEGHWTHSMRCCVLSTLTTWRGTQSSLYWGTQSSPPHTLALSACFPSSSSLQQPRSSPPARPSSHSVSRSSLWRVLQDFFVLGSALRTGFLVPGFQILTSFWLTSIFFSCRHPTSGGSHLATAVLPATLSAPAGHQSPWLSLLTRSDSFSAVLSFLSHAF